MLSPRESQTLTFAAVGLTDKEIAVRLGVSLGTVRTYWERLNHKSGAVNRAEAVALFVQGRADKIPRIPDADPEPNTLLQAAIDATVGGIIVLNPDLTIATTNEKMCRLLNCVLGSMEGQSIETYIPKRYFPFYATLKVATSAEPENAYTVSSFIRVHDGRDLLATITIRTLLGAKGRHPVLFIQDSISEDDARRRGHATSW